MCLSGLVTDLDMCYINFHDYFYEVYAKYLKSKTAVCFARFIEIHLQSKSISASRTKWFHNNKHFS